MKNLIFCFAFTIALTLIVTGLHKGNVGIIESGSSFLFFMLLAFIGNTISELKKEKINIGMLKIAIPLFMLSVGALIYGSYINQIAIASVISLIFGILFCVLLLYPKKKK